MGSCKNIHVGSFLSVDIDIPPPPSGLLEICSFDYTEVTFTSVFFFPSYCIGYLIDVCSYINNLTRSLLISKCPSITCDDVC